MNRIPYLSISFFALGLVAFAVGLQQLGYQNVSFLPCPLCILQRIAYLGIAVSCFLAASFASSRKWFHALAAISAAIGVIIAGKQVWLLSHPESSCGIDPLEVWINQFHFVQSLPWLLKAGGLCSAQLPAILGLQVPQWSLLWFCVLLAIFVLTFFKNGKATV